MKKTFDSFNHCMELREVIFLRSLPNHPHLVPALDIFLDPLTKKLHIAMEYMDGNLYQLMKARDHKCLDGASVKSILFQIISGLEHIHANQFFHRDIKPENILVSTSAPQDAASTFRRYSALVTPPSTPPAYTVKIADFGLARETHSKLPYTTYVSTRWYRAPEVLLRAGEYSAPVDIWAVGAMAVEIATLKPLFPGSNEVDQVWRVCEVMGSPGSWVNKHGARVGGGEWREGVKLASKLGFSFPKVNNLRGEHYLISETNSSKMAPHSLDTILRAPQWPASLSEFVTWCLMWDPKSRPTSTQALAHDYFRDAADPLRPKSSRYLGRKQSNVSTLEPPKEAMESTHSLSSKTSNWFRKSLIQREISAPAVAQHAPPAQTTNHPPTPLRSTPADGSNSLKVRPNANKRATWANGIPANAAPMPILPSIRPVSPISDAVHAQAVKRHTGDDKKKVGRQLSVASHGNHYADIHRLEAERALNGHSGLASPTSSGHKEGFFSHLRKRARRFSGRYQTPMSPNADDVEATAGCAPWQQSRQSTLLPSIGSGEFTDLDKALQNVRTSMDMSNKPISPPAPHKSSFGGSLLKRHHSTGAARSNSKTRKAAHKQSQSNLHYDTPDEEEELLSEALSGARTAANRLDHTPVSGHYPTSGRTTVRQQSNPYLTPNPSANRTSAHYGHTDYGAAPKPLDILRPQQPRQEVNPKWPTPPYESDWGASLSASLLAVPGAYR
jgi:meiosis induction protein kinase IME2/SME1